MSITVVAALLEDQHFAGCKRTLIADCADLRRETNFNDKASAIGIHLGPNSAAGNTETVSFFEHINFAGMELVLSFGAFPELHRNDFGNFGDIISSVRFNRAKTRPPGIYDQSHNLVALVPSPAANANPIRPIPLIVELYLDGIQINPHTGGLPKDLGEGICLLQSSRNLDTEFDYNDVVTGVIVKKGPDFAGEKIRLYPDAGFRGVPIEFGPDDLNAGSPALPGVIANLIGLGFNDKLSSVVIPRT